MERPVAGRRYKIIRCRDNANCGQRERPGVRGGRVTFDRIAPFFPGAHVHDRRWRFAYQRRIASIPPRL